jgi:hypothetical protein
LNADGTATVVSSSTSIFRTFLSDADFKDFYETKGSQEYDFRQDAWYFIASFLLLVLSLISVVTLWVVYKRRRFLIHTQSELLNTQIKQVELSGVTLPPELKKMKSDVETNLDKWREEDQQKYML